MTNMKTQGIEEISKFAMEVIQRAGEKALAYYGKGRPSIKFDEGLVTEAELDLTDFFENQLKSSFSGHHIFKDNFDETDYTHEGKRYLWIFDPLDGTSNFQAGIPIWGLSLALIENFWPVFGVVCLPATNDLFHAQAGNQAFWGKEKIAISPLDTINDESLLLTYSRFHLDYASGFPGKVRALGCTAAHICYVAMGRADAAVISNESFQGLAAARVVIEAAGGMIYKSDGSKFHLNEYLNGQKIEDHLLVASPGIFSQISETLNRTY